MIKIKIHKLDLEKNPHAKLGEPWPIMTLSDGNKVVEKHLYWWTDSTGYVEQICGRCIKLSSKILRQVIHDNKQ